MRSQRYIILFHTSNLVMSFLAYEFHRQTQKLINPIQIPGKSDKKIV